MPVSTNIQNRQICGGDLEPVAIARVLVDIPVTFAGGIDANIQVGDVDVSAVNPVPVTAVAVIPGTGATNLGKQEDELHATGDTGVMMLGVRNDADAVMTTVDLSYGSISLDDRGRVKTAPVVPAIMGLAAHVHAPAADTAAVVTLAAAGAGVQNVLKSIHWGYDAAPATATTLIVEDGAGTTIFTTYITAGGPGFEMFEDGRAGSPNTAMIVTLSTGGAGVSGSLTLHAGTQ